MPRPPRRQPECHAALSQTRSQSHWHVASLGASLRVRQVCQPECVGATDSLTRSAPTGSHRHGGTERPTRGQCPASTSWHQQHPGPDEGLGALSRWPEVRGGPRCAHGDSESTASGPVAVSRIVGFPRGLAARQTPSQAGDALRGCHCIIACITRTHESCNVIYTTCISEAQWLKL